ncbi:hypothetical protein MJH12_04040 [bacterium]|nr:hypothetical protein [bacterium]
MILSFLLFSFYQKDLYEQSHWILYQDVSQKIHSKHQNIDRLIIGDSRIKAIYKCKKNELNLSLPNQTAIESYFILKGYLKSNQKPKSILLSFAPYHLIRNLSFYDRMISFEFLLKHQLDQVNAQAHKLQDDHLDPYHYYKSKYLPNMYLHKIKRAYQYKQWIKNQEAKDYIKRYQGFYPFGKSSGNSERNDETTIQKIPYSKTIEHYLQKLVTLAKEHHIRIDYYTAPINISSCQVLSKEFFKKHHQYLQKFEFHRLNSLECWPDRLFGDPSHLFLGAEKAQLEISNYLDHTIRK